MTTTTRNHECSAVELYLAFELGSTKWTLGFATSPAQRPRVRTIGAGDLAALRRELDTAKVRLGLPLATPVRSCYEAGRDGFWLHRWLEAEGIRNLVVDSSSIEVNRRRRHVKTDRLDVRRLVSLLLRWVGGESKVWSVVHVPSVAAEDERQLVREIQTVETDRLRVRNRIKGLMADHGVAVALEAQFAEQLAMARTGDGRPVPPGLRARLLNEWALLQTVEARAAALAEARGTYIAAAQTRAARIAATLMQLRGVAEKSALVFSAELFGTRTFSNPRQVGALCGLAPVPYRSDQCVQDQGIGKTGRGELRRVAIQIAWGWLRWQPQSALTQWFNRRFAPAGKRARRIGIVAVARKLLIALWRFTAQGVIPDGAVLKPTA
jgi:transposase